MKKHCVRVITVPLPIPDRNEGDGGGYGFGEPEGEHPDHLASRCKALENYVVNVRLPAALKDVKVWVESRVRPEESRYMLDLLIFYSGQLPLQFKAPRGKGINAGLLEEMDRLAARIEDALARSNEVWNLAAEIVNTEVDPGDEIEHVRLTSGYPVPNRGRRAKVPAILQLLSRSEPLPLFTPEMRPEYIESGQLIVKAKVTLNSDRLRLCVDDVDLTDTGSLASSRVRRKDRLAPRWPDADPRPWILLHGSRSSWKCQ